jgi:hypothetical protein
VFGMNAIAAFVLAGLIGRVATMIKVHDRASGSPVALLTFCKEHVKQAVHSAGAWWAHALPQLPPLDTPNNLSLAWALVFVLSVFLVLLVMYAFKIFLKV